MLQIGATSLMYIGTRVQLGQIMKGGSGSSARTVMMLTERLDHHRGRGQQQITVKHVTTNNVTADQAIIAESVTTGAGRNVASPALLAAHSATPMPILNETKQSDQVGGGQKTK